MLVAVLVVSVLVVLWRIGHRRRRRLEAAALRVQWRPLSEFDARFPAERTVRSLRGKRRGLGL